MPAKRTRAHRTRATRARREGAKTFLARLGLKAPYTKSAEDYEASEVVGVRQLYQIDIIKYCKMHVHESMKDIRTSGQVKKEAQELFNAYGPRIWARCAERPWLFKPSKQEHGVYKRDLYYDDPKDRQILEKQFVGLVISKMCRYVQEYTARFKAFQESEPSQPVYPESSPPPSANHVTDSSDSELERPNEKVCHHLDGVSLRRQGVWLGDWDHAKWSVNGRSWFTLREDYYLAAQRDSDTGAVHPPTQEEMGDETSETVRCLACSDGSPIQIQQLKFGWGKNEEEFIRYLWVYPCQLETRNVFAILGMVQPMSNGTGVDTWSFWMLDGSTSQDLLLARPTGDTMQDIEHGLEAGSDSDPGELAASGSSKYNTRATPQSLGTLTAISRHRAHRAPSDFMSHKDDEAPDPSHWSDIPEPSPSNADDTPPAATPLYGGKDTKLTQGSLSIIDARSAEDTITLRDPVRRLENSFLSPFRPKVCREETRASSGGQPFAAHVPRESSETMRPPSSMTEITYGLAARSVKPHVEHGARSDRSSILGESLCLYFTVNEASKYNLVKLDPTTTFETAYERIEAKLYQKYGKALVSVFDLTFRLPYPDGTHDGIEVTVDDEDSWNIVRERVKEQGLKDIYGTVSMEE